MALLSDEEKVLATVVLNQAITNEVGMASEFGDRAAIEDIQALALALGVQLDI